MLYSSNAVRFLLLKACTTSVVPGRVAGSARSHAAMAAEILQKKHRFILVSDLDWTMVSILPSRRTQCSLRTWLGMPVLQVEHQILDS